MNNCVDPTFKYVWNVAKHTTRPNTFFSISATKELPGSTNWLASQLLSATTNLTTKKTNYYKL